ncbi:delta(1)-pyrroline-2-carboxylate reductase [Prunus yedoensis var. nudiflora]|uniref:Delta(1)-pyrroline-2-carboxylate reductase n=1 Tax=Prunus yedoensis var. nudiflora TaxID=2094558 RepID=A0A314ZN59_PRUYE|nr:delta(1)-pyrroline-2-carboxylate reductase [Prunus yedoensis var. nudiflora]PQQ18281.1 delta(1)-pyrroline-2-carboxylate reductase [Prunus yedoensis var. nudiflora]
MDGTALTLYRTSCDDEAMRRGRVFVDNEAALVEELIKGDKAGRRSCEEITVFKSVGSAVVDILAAQLVYETYIMQPNR